MKSFLIEHLGLVVLTLLLIGVCGLLWYDYIHINDGATNSPIAHMDDPTVDGICGAHGFRVWYQPVGGNIAKVEPDPTCPRP